MRVAYSVLVALAALDLVVAAHAGGAGEGVQDVDWEAWISYEFCLSKLFRYLRMSTEAPRQLPEAIGPMRPERAPLLVSLLELLQQEMTCSPHWLLASLGFSAGVRASRGPAATRAAKEMIAATEVKAFILMVGWLVLEKRKLLKSWLLGVEVKLSCWDADDDLLEGNPEGLYRLLKTSERYCRSRFVSGVVRGSTIIVVVNGVDQAMMITVYSWTLSFTPDLSEAII
jgi:hypothetical protein